MRKLWRLGFQASLEEVVTAGGALQFVLAERFGGRSAIVIGSAAIHHHVEAAGLRIVNDTAFASRADVVVVAYHPRFDYAELQRRVAGGAARRVRSSASTATRRSRCPTACGPARAPCSPRSRWRRGARRTSSASPSRCSCRRRSTASAPVAR